MNIQGNMHPCIYFCIFSKCWIKFVISRVHKIHFNVKSRKLWSTFFAAVFGGRTTKFAFWFWKKTRVKNVDFCGFCTFCLPTKDGYCMVNAPFKTLLLKIGKNFGAKKKTMSPSLTANSDFVAATELRWET